MSATSYKRRRVTSFEIGDIYSKLLDNVCGATVFERMHTVLMMVFVRAGWRRPGW